MTERRIETVVMAQAAHGVKALQKIDGSKISIGSTTSQLWKAIYISASS